MSNNNLLNSNLNKHVYKTLFVSLVNENKWETLIEMFTHGVLDINIKDERGRNCLYWAIKKNKIEIIKVLIKLNINTKEVSSNLSAINYAVCQDNVKVLKCLKNCGLDINEVDNVNSTPLIYAVLYNKINSTNYFIQNGSNIHHEDFLGNSPFNIAHNLKITYLISKFEENSSL